MSAEAALILHEHFSLARSGCSFTTNVCPRQVDASHEVVTALHCVVIAAFVTSCAQALERLQQNIPYLPATDYKHMLPYSWHCALSQQGHQQSLTEAQCQGFCGLLVSAGLWYLFQVGGRTAGLRMNNAWLSDQALVSSHAQTCCHTPGRLVEMPHILGACMLCHCRVQQRRQARASEATYAWQPLNVGGAWHAWSRETLPAQRCVQHEQLALRCRQAWPAPASRQTGLGQHPRPGKGCPGMGSAAKGRGWW